MIAGASAVPCTAANYVSSTGAGTGWTSVQGPTDEDEYDQSAPGGSNSGSAVNVTIPGDANGLATGVSLGRAGNGAVSAFAEAMSAASTVHAGVSSSSQSSARATAAFSDTFSINAPGHANGTPAVLTYRVAISGAAGGGGNMVQGLNGVASWSGTTFWRVHAAVNGSSLDQEQSTSDSSNQGLIVSGTGSPGTYEVDTNVTLGSNVTVFLQAEVSSQAVAGADFYSTSSASSAFNSSLGGGVGWGGIVGLRTQTGDLITDFTATSTTVPGLDYATAAPVPEPDARVALMAGVGVLAAAIRKLRR